MDNNEMEKEEFVLKLSVATIDLDNYIQSLTSFDNQLQQPKLTLNLLLGTKTYDESCHEIVNNCFVEFNKLKKVLSRIESRRDAIKTTFPLGCFKKFYIDPHQFNQKIIELNDAIKKCKEKVDAQIIKCIEYFNERDIQIAL